VTEAAWGEAESDDALPAAARERLRRLRDAGRWAAQLDPGQQGALAAVGFSPVGQVMGASVWSLNQTGRGVCGGYRTSYTPTRYSTGAGLRSGGAYSDPGSSSVASHVGRRRTPYMQALGPLVRTFTQSRRSALRRLQAEAAALGADGVIGVRVTVEPFPGSAQRSLSFIAVGTAVRSVGTKHLAGPFLSDLGASDLALLLRAGWMPTGLVMGVGAVVAHDSYYTAQRRRLWTGNVEIPGFSDLATQARVDARARLNEDIRLHLGEAAVLGDLSVFVHEQKCTKGGPGSADTDHLVEAVLLGTAISRFALPVTSAVPEPLPMIRLGGGRRTAPMTEAVTDPFTHGRGQ
jgi:uncharacterized protein YbjQ (UPF0145 family)